MHAQNVTNHHAHSCHLATWWLLVIVHNHVHRCLPPCDQVTAVRCAHHWLLSCSQVAADPHAHPWLLPCRQRTANPGRAAKTQLQLQLDLALLQKIMVPERAGNTRPTPAFHALRLIFAEIMQPRAPFRLPRQVCTETRLPQLKGLGGDFPRHRGRTPHFICFCIIRQDPIAAIEGSCQSLCAC